MTVKFDLLVYLGFGLIVLTILAGLIVTLRLRPAESIEQRKLRIATGAFVAIMVVSVFVACLYAGGEPEGPGRQIFDKGLTAMFTLIGSIAGYIFGIGRAIGPERCRAQGQEVPSDAARGAT